MVTALTHYFQSSWELWISPLTRWNNQNREMKHSETQVHITILWVPLTVVSAIGLSIFICSNWRITVLLAQTRRIRDKRRRNIYDTQSSKLFLALKIICLDNILILSLEYEDEVCAPICFLQLFPPHSYFIKSQQDNEGFVSSLSAICSFPRV